MVKAFSRLESDGAMTLDFRNYPKLAVISQKVVGDYVEVTLSFLMLEKSRNAKHCVPA